MAFTDFSDLFASVHEDGVNKIINHIMLQRPSLFNYGTVAVSRAKNLLCTSIPRHEIVEKRAQPLLTIETPIPVVGVPGLGMDFVIQIPRLRVDFAPQNQMDLPPELGELGDQQIGFHVAVCIGLACPEEEAVQTFVEYGREAFEQDREVITLPAREMTCFCLDLYVVATIGMREIDKDTFELQPTLVGLEIVDIKPEGLESGLECYLSLLTRLVLLPRLTQAIDHIVIDTLPYITVTLKPSTSVPNNPAVEEDLLKVYVDMEVS